MKKTRNEIHKLYTLFNATNQLLGEMGRRTHRDALNDFGSLIDEIEEIKEEPMNIEIQDKIVLSVMARFKERSDVGIRKYNTTLERTDLSTLQWLQHAQDEAMDFVLYLERLKQEYKNK
jgi:hypothetical protein